ncbi:HAMP domain-containing histidine kinase [Alteromonas sp. 5E99-2]|uniref:sensor histidine kinase n=1 Tax=Alteromonas sp. 5E99-2 TaxID=2817683 RepID=UPI001A994D90|nr:HAMP domain-containing sensor histidine kinase [Alteromonas sp. 5E99-2]MBO1254451.1 HAMP domain-containing histidine kinase [Alteromonas sp. 5E99-2]
MAHVKTGLSRKLLTRVLSLYFALTLTVTFTQIIVEYHATKSNVEDELRTLKNTFSTSLTRAIWELNLEQAESIALGLMEIPIVEGVQIRDENGQFVAQLGIAAQNFSENDIATSGQMTDYSGGVFGYSFPLIFEFSGRTSNVGDVTLYSNFDIIFGRIEIGVILLIANAILKTAFLIFLFMSAFKTMLSTPLRTITRQMMEFNAERPQDSKLSLHIEDDNELRQLTNSYNHVIDDLVASRDTLKSAQNELEYANEKLDNQNLLLEQEVAKKTASLSHIMLDLEQQKDELIVKQRELKQENENRQYIENELRRKNNELASSMGTLRIARDQLLESERMASLGGLVAGIAHDINTPLGVSVTASSFMQERIKSLKTKYADNAITKSAMDDFFKEVEQTSDLLLNNLYRASDLIASFKQVAVDQTSEAERCFDLNEYLHEILSSLLPSFKHSQHTITIECPEQLQIFCAPGVIAQIITNMIMNSHIHGYDEGIAGQILIHVTEENNDIVLVYEDDGKGLSSEHLDKLFDAFFTTAADIGGSGLGTHIMYNLANQALKGKITASSKMGKGLKYTIRFPKRT